jgi:SAM-dependent methyltransferase
MARMTGAAHDNVLVPKWLPTVPDVQQRLIDGCSVADVGCGQGRAITALAWAFPASTFTGYDPLPGQLDAARRHAQATGVADRIQLVRADAIAGLPDQHDVIWLFDVLHDTADPAALVRSIHDALHPDGVALVLEPNAGDALADNVGPVGALEYGMSVLYCLPVARAAGAEGLGTLGSTEATLRELFDGAGFVSVTEAPIDNPFNRLWVARR